MRTFRGRSRVRGVRVGLESELGQSGVCAGEKQAVLALLARELVAIQTRPASSSASSFSSAAAAAANNREAAVTVAPSLSAAIAAVASHCGPKCRHVGRSSPRREHAVRADGSLFRATAVLYLVEFRVCFDLFVDDRLFVYSYVIRTLPLTYNSITAENKVRLYRQIVLSTACCRSSSVSTPPAAARRRRDGTGARRPHGRPAHLTSVVAPAEMAGAAAGGRRRGPREREGAYFAFLMPLADLMLISHH